MSDGEVHAAIEQMEAWIADPTWDPDPEALVKWNAEFQAAVTQAEKSEQWPDLVTRAHRLGQDLEAHVVRMTQLRDAVKAELDAQERGNRALMGYGRNAR